MFKGLIGNTGFVGSNLINQTEFDLFYNSTNINEIRGKEIDLLVIAAPSAVKWKANQEPELDLQMIKDLIKHLEKVKAKQVVQISTVDIYKNTTNANEDTPIDTNGLHPYGNNRFFLEEFVRKKFNNHLIVRLPALFGNGLKKNFIYDLINLIPTSIPENKYLELSQKNNFISNFYIKQENNSYKCKDVSEKEKIDLKKYFANAGFNALNFTDSESIFQFYNLDNLWQHIQISIKNNIKTINLCTEPISANELYKFLKNSDFNNKITDNPPHYDLKTKYFEFFNGKNGYIFNKNYILEEVKKFIKIQI